MRIEDQIKRTVEHHVANRPSQAGVWEGVLKRFRRQQRVRITAAIVGGAAVVAALGVVVPKLGHDRQVVPIESPTTAPTGGPTTSPTPVVAFPAEAVALDNVEDRIVVISTTSGKVLRVLAQRAASSPENLSPFHGDLSLSGDRTTVYFTRSGSNVPCDNKIMSVPIAGGEEREVAEGWSPSASPDGRYLAYQGQGSGPNCGNPPLVVRNLQTGDERRWTWAAENAEDPYQSGGPFSLEWSPDSRSIAFTRNVGDPLYEVWVLDTTIGETFLDARKISPDGVGDLPNRSWSSPAFLNSETLIAAQETRSIHDSPDGPLHVLVTFDPATTDGEPVALFDPQSAVLDMSVAPGGAVLFASGNGLFRYQDGAAEKIADGRYIRVAW